MSQKNQALIFLIVVSIGTAYFSIRIYPSTEWIALGIIGSLFFLFALLIIFLGNYKIRYATKETQDALKKLLEKKSEPYHKKQFALEDQDIKVLERHVPWTYAGFVFAVLTAVLILLWDDFLSTSSSTKFVGQLLSAFLGTGSLLVSIIFLVIFKSRTKRIRKHGIKTVIRGIVTGRRVEDNRLDMHNPRRETTGFRGEVFYYLILGEKEFDIDYKNFSQTTDGDAVEIHYVTDALGKPLVLHFHLLKKEIVSK
ncbi:MAG: hypothetical protein ABIK73_09430 [candidate division WOR-3 bacterium]